MKRWLSKLIYLLANTCITYWLCIWAFSRRSAGFSCTVGQHFGFCVSHTSARWRSQLHWSNWEFCHCFQLRLQETKTHYSPERWFSVQKRATVPRLSGTLSAVTQLGFGVLGDGPDVVSPADTTSCPTYCNAGFCLTFYNYTLTCIPSFYSYFVV